MKIQFTKYHANGNDFILVMNEDLPAKFRQPKIINRLCSRRTGIGADGMFIISPSKDYDFFLDYYNADGSWNPCVPMVLVVLYILCIPNDWLMPI